MIQTLELDGDRALFEGKLQGMIVTCYMNERPLRGLAGLLDWRFQGVISHCLKVGVITGRAGECAYIPVSRGGKSYHLLLVGGGHLSSDGKREALPRQALTVLQKNLASLGLQQIGISRSDFGGADEKYFKEQFKDLALWIVQ